MKYKTWFVVTLAGVSFLLGGFGISTAFAKGSKAKTSSSQVQTETGGKEGKNADKNDPSYTGSISLKDQQTNGDETSEAANLQKYAVISADDAANSALGAHPGTSVAQTSLENENGFLVYSVVLNNGIDAKVDAGNGQVLHQETAGRDEHGHGGKNERAVEKEHNEKNERNDKDDRDHEDVQIEE